MHALSFSPLKYINCPSTTTRRKEERKKKKIESFNINVNCLQSIKLWTIFLHGFFPRPIITACPVIIYARAMKMVGNKLIFIWRQQPTRFFHRFFSTTNILLLDDFTVFMYLYKGIIVNHCSFFVCQTPHLQRVKKRNGSVMGSHWKSTNSCECEKVFPFQKVWHRI